MQNNTSPWLPDYMLHPYADSFEADGKKFYHYHKYKMSEIPEGHMFKFICVRKKK